MLYHLAEHITYAVILPSLATTSDSVVSNFSRFSGRAQGVRRLFFYYLVDVLSHLDIAKPINLQYNKRRRNLNQFVHI